MAISEQDVMEDLAYAEAEGPSDMADMADITDMMESDFYEDEDSADLTEDYFGEDDADFGEDAYESGEALLTKVIGNALGAEDEDEFLGKLFSGIKNIAKKVAPVIGKIGRAAAPILSAIPLPQAQLAGKLAGLAGKLRAEGGTVEDALEAVAEIAARDQRAIPVVAGLAARSVIKNRGASMPAAKRQKIAVTMHRAAKTLVANGGQKAIRAMPRITRSVKRTSAGSGTPPSVQPRIVARTAAKVAQNPALLRRLSAPSPQGQAIANGAMGGMMGGTMGRTISVPGPATITIRAS
ncbi:MAG: hypothetical protein ACRET4_08285 [Steroidobacteraceae bacterium]